MGRKGGKERRPAEEGEGELCTLDAVIPVNPEDSWTLEPGPLPSLCPGFSLLAFSLDG